MWQFDYTLPTLILQSYIAILFVLRKRLPIRLTRVYSAMLAANLLTLALDYLSASMDNQWDIYQAGVLNTINLLFFLAFIVRIFLFARFTLVLMKQWDPKSMFCRLAYKVPLILMLVLTASSLLTGLIFRITDHGYAYGPLYFLINLSIFFCCILIEASLMKGKKTAPEVRRTGAHMYVAVLLTGGMIRVLFPQILVMNMFCMFANAVILFEYLNPEGFVDQSTDLFNLRGWRAVLDDVYRTIGKKQVRIIGFVIKDFNGLRDVYGDQQMEEGTRMIGQYLNQNFRDMNAFYVEDGRFILMSSQAVAEDEILENLRQRFSQHWRCEHTDLVLQAGMMRVSRACTFPDQKTATGFLRYAFRMAANPSQRSITVADSKLLAEYQRLIYVRRCLSHAIESGAVEMYLQPIFSAHTGLLEGAEALARIRDDDGRLIWPDEFIPVAESNGMIEALGEEMFRKACAFMAREEVKNSSLKWLNVNLSPLQCMDASLADTYYRIYRTFNLKPYSIYLEITEQSLNDSSVLHKQMIRLQEDGIPFVLDDFGSMSSNLERLKENPFICVKLDKNMVWSYMKEPDFIVPHVISACHEMNIRVTAEGIEDENMISVFSKLGCDYFQGFYYSKPIPEADFRTRYCQEDRA